MKASMDDNSYSALPLKRMNFDSIRPRDERGRFTKKKKIVLIDESGDMGTNRDSRRWFALTAMVSDRPDILADIPKRYPPNTREKLYDRGEELKFTTSSDLTRISILKEIALTRPLVFAIETDKWTKDPYSTWPKTGSKLYVKSVEFLIEQIACNSQGELHIMFDRNTALHPMDAMRICKQMSEKHKVHLVCLNPAVNSRFEPLMQTNDFITGSIGFKMNSYEKDNERFFRIIEDITKETRM